ncbi:MAG: hypothetical protein HQK77_13980 [Desulfobacterales bacterium]|nr:hypothetical protein [Desulfobacterales bacterium]
MQKILPEFQPLYANIKIRRKMMNISMRKILGFENQLRGEWKNGKINPV